MALDREQVAFTLFNTLVLAHHTTSSTQRTHELVEKAFHLADAFLQELERQQDA
jgi:hypothetical protein